MFRSSSLVCLCCITVRGTLVLSKGDPDHAPNERHQPSRSLRIVAAALTPTPLKPQAWSARAWGFPFTRDDVDPPSGLPARATLTSQLESVALVI